MAPLFSERIAMKAKIGSFIVMTWIIIIAVQVLFRNRRYLRTLPKSERKEAFYSLLKESFSKTFYGDMTYENKRSNQ